MIALPLAIFWFAAVLLSIMDGRRKATGWVAVAALAAGLLAALRLTLYVAGHGPMQLVAGGWEPGVGIVIAPDMLGLSFLLILLAVLLAALVFEVLNGVRSRTFPSLILFVATGLTGLFLTGDAFNFYVFFEITMIASYVLACYGGTPRQLRAGTIFAVVNLLGSAFFLIGVVSLYHLTGTLEMRGIATAIAPLDTQSVIVTATLILVAFSVKLGLFPFHFWLPAVYTGTRPAVAAVLSGAVANIGGYGLMRFGGQMLPRELEFGAPALILLGGLSILYGAIQAVSRRSIAEVLAYSAIGQAGYIMIAIAIGGPLGYSAAVLFALFNSWNKALLFLSEHLRGWLVGAAFAIGAFSVVGVPPAAGFFAKIGLFRAGLGGDHYLIVALLFAGGALSFVYMFQAYQLRFWSGEAADQKNSDRSLRLLVIGLAIALLVVGVWPEPAIDLSQRAASVLPERTP